MNNFQNYNTNDYLGILSLLRQIIDYPSMYSISFKSRHKLSNGGIPSIPIPHTINTIDRLKLPINFT